MKCPCFIRVVVGIVALFCLVTALSLPMAHAGIVTYGVEFLRAGQGREAFDLTCTILGMILGLVAFFGGMFAISAD